MHVHAYAVVEAVCVFTERACERRDFIIHKALVRNRDLIHASVIFHFRKERDRGTKSIVCINNII